MHLVFLACPHCLRAFSSVLRVADEVEVIDDLRGVTIGSQGWMRLIMRIDPTGEWRFQLLFLFSLLDLALCGD